MSVSWKDGTVPIVGEYIELLAASGSGKRRASAAARGLAGSLHCVTARDGARLVAMGRIVGDGGLAVTITDVAVHPDWRGQGLGTGVMERLMAWCADDLPAGCVVSAIPVPGSFSLFRRFGFEIRTGMGRHLE